MTTNIRFPLLLDEATKQNLEYLLESTIHNSRGEVIRMLINAGADKAKATFDTAEKEIVFGGPPVPAAHDDGRETQPIDPMRDDFDIMDRPVPINLRGDE